jgi:hypothetical protein
MSRTEFIVVVLLGLALVCPLSIRTVNAQAGQTTLKVTDDTYVKSDSPNSNYGGLDDLMISDYQSSGHQIYERMTWLKFNLSSVPDGAVVDIATLQLHTSVVDEQYDIHAYPCSNNSWTELTLTYSNMPSYNTTSMDSVLVKTDSSWYNWSVVDSVRNALSGNPRVVTIVMYAPSSLHDFGSSVLFDSKESPTQFGIDYSPELTVHWSNTVPEFSTTLLLPFFMTATLMAAVLYKCVKIVRYSAKKDRYYQADAAFSSHFLRSGCSF